MHLVYMIPMSEPMLTIIRALGSPAGKFEIKMGYPRAALKAFTEHLAPALSEKQQFRFILLSGELVIANQERWVPPPFNALQELVSPRNTSQSAY